MSFDDWFIRTVYPGFRFSGVDADPEEIFNIKVFDASIHATNTLDDFKKLLAKIEEVTLKLTPLTITALEINNSI